MSSSLARRDFLKQSAATVAAASSGSPMGAAQSVSTNREVNAYQQKRLKLLWSLLGYLPISHRPKPAKLVKTEKGDGYTLEYLTLDLNGIEPVPALLLIPDKRQNPAPGLLYIHWHGGTYPTGKDELLTGRKVLPAYAPVVAEKGIDRKSTRLNSR